MGATPLGLFSALVGPLSLLAGIFLALYVKDKARDIAKSEVAEGMKLALATFKNELVITLDLMYPRTPELKLMLDNRDDQLEVIKDRLDVHDEAIKSLETTTALNCNRNIELERRIVVIEKNSSKE